MSDNAKSTTFPEILVAFSVSKLGLLNQVACIFCAISSAEPLATWLLVKNVYACPPLTNFLKYFQPGHSYSNPIAYEFLGKF